MSRRQVKPASILQRVRDAARHIVRGSGAVQTITNTHDLVKAIAAGRQTASGVNVNEHNALGVPAVFACVRIIAQALAQCPWQVTRIEEREGGMLSTHTLRDHRVTALLNITPNRYGMSPFTFKQLLVGHMLLRGNAYCYIRRDATGLPIELIPLHPERMSIDDVIEDGPGGEFTVIYKYSWLHGKQQWFMGPEILHLRALTTDGLMGVSFLDIAREAVGLTIQQQHFAAKLFSNGANPQGMLKHPQKLSAEIVERLRGQIEAYQGANNAHKTVILEEGMDWVKMSFTAEEAQFNDGRKFQRSEVAMFFGVPPGMLGDVDKQTSWGTGMAEARNDFINMTIQAWAQCIQDQLRISLLPERDLFGHEIRIDLERLLMGDLGQRASAYATLHKIGAVNPNEVRAKLGLNPRDDDWGDDYVHPGESVDKQMRQIYDTAATALEEPRRPALPEPARQLPAPAARKKP